MVTLSFIHDVISFFRTRKCQKIWLLLKPGPGPWKQALKNLDPYKAGPWKIWTRKTWTVKNLDFEKPGPKKTWTLKKMDPGKHGISMGLKNMSDFRELWFIKIMHNVLKSFFKSSKISSDFKKVLSTKLLNCGSKFMEASLQNYFQEKVFWKYAESLQVNIHAEVWF